MNDQLKERGMSLKLTRLKLTGLLLLLLAILPVSSFARDLPNLAQIKQQLVQYHDSGQYQRDINNVAERVMRYVTKKTAQNSRRSHPKKLAAVFDIDETALSNYPHMRKRDFGGTMRQIKYEEGLGTDIANPGMLKLYRFTREHGVAVFFVTGRRAYERSFTRRNLKRAGYKGWTALYLKPNNYRLKSAIPYKTGARKKITAKGYTIIYTIGDQYSDLKGGYAMKTFKLPNPYYYIP
jgi:acid phosphatase